MHFKTSFFTLFLFFISLNLFAQNLEDLLDLRENKTPEGKIQILGKNKAFCPISIEVGFDQVKNLKPNHAMPHKVVIPAGEEIVMLVLTPKKNSNYGYGLNFSFMFGDYKAKSHNHDYVYSLPFKKEKSFELGQGYDGNFSHQGEYCLDFQMPVGTEVYAARGGIVASIKEDSNSGCRNASCQSYGNYIEVYHEDGTFSNYYHLQQDGCLVKAGDNIEAGQLIGHSGNTGFSSGPHLHFEVYMPGFEKNKTIPTVFHTQNNKAEKLVEGKIYTAQ